MRLRVVDEVIDVADEIVTAASHRALVSPFAAPADVSPALTLALDPALVGGLPLILDGDQLGEVGSSHAAFTFRLSAHPLAGLAALRLGWLASVLRQGGLLIHGCAVRFASGAALLATGPSGAGKSTLARLCCEAAEATLLSDEIVALLPNGRVCGSPFFSDYRAEGSPVVAPLALALRLSKAAEERLSDLPATEFARLAFSQAFRTSALPVSNAEMLARIGAALSGVKTAELAFRKNPEAARFIAARVQGRSG